MRLRDGLIGQTGGVPTSPYGGVATYAPFVSLLAGDYWVQGYQASRPTITTATTKFSDGTNGDVTTFESVTTALGTEANMTARKVLASSAKFTSVLITFAFNDSVERMVLERWNGAAWVTDFVSGVPALGAVADGVLNQKSLTWVLDGVTPVQDIRFSLGANGTGSANCFVRVSDWRFS